MANVSRLMWASMRGAAAAALLFAASPPAAAVKGDVVVLGGLDKTTARVSTFEAPIGEPVRFGALEITARTCDRTPPEEPPESAAFLEIREIKPDEDVQPRLFTGWMFASSPALSALEHPIYDVWVLECKVSSTSSAAESSSAD